MTGSAGTAMDVLVTCFSKKGGGSGRRGCKNRAGLVSLETFGSSRVSKSVAGAILWTHLRKRGEKSDAF